MLANSQWRAFIARWQHWTCCTTMLFSTGTSRILTPPSHMFCQLIINFKPSILKIEDHYCCGHLQLYKGFLYRPPRSNFLCFPRIRDLSSSPPPAPASSRVLTLPHSARLQIFFLTKNIRFSGFLEKVKRTFCLRGPSQKMAKIVLTPSWNANFSPSFLRGSFHGPEHFRTSDPRSE